MPNQKLENILNLAIETPEEERQKSLNLNVGFEEQTRSWELIVKYNGSLEQLANSGIQVEELIAGYAILKVPENLVEALADINEIEYVEKPKRLFFSTEEGKVASCILPVTIRPPFLSGKNTIVAVLDSGIDYVNPDFRNADGTTRIISIWDQTIAPNEERGYSSPAGFLQGTEFTREQINLALETGTREGAYALVPSRDSSGHGTAVIGIAAGNGRGGGEQYSGVAPDSELLVVKLGIPSPDSFPRTTELMRGLTYVVKKAAQLKRPVAINLSFGNTYGAHDGNSLLERFIDNISEIGRTVICVGSGNEGASAGHLTGEISTTNPIGRVELAIAPYEPSLNVQLWKNYADNYQIRLQSPNGAELLIPMERSGKLSYTMEQTRILIYMGEPRPYSSAQEIYFDFIPVDTYINSGIWLFEIIPISYVTGKYYFYLPSDAARNSGTRFFFPTPDVTLTIPSTTRRVITVGAYNSVYQAYADFSGRGYTCEQKPVGVVSSGAAKPDIVAPGVDIVAPDIYGGYSAFTGTSFACPFVTGAAALLMEFGITNRNDPFLFGEKVKAYLIRGARHLPGIEEWPNAMLGWGALCVRDSLPV